MPTEFIHALRSSGGDYTTPQAWADDMDSDQTAASSLVFAHSGITGTVSDGDTVTGQTSGATGIVTGVVTDAGGSGQIYLTGITGGPFTAGGEVMQVSAGNSVSNTGPGDSVIAVLECYNDWPSGLAERVSLAITWITSATNGIIMRAPVGQRHDGTPGSGFHMKKAESFSTIIDANTADTSIEYLDLQNTGANNNAAGLALSNKQRNQVIGCLITAQGNGILQVGGFGIIRNNVVYGISGGSAGIGLNMQSGDGMTCQNNVVSGFATGINWSGTGNGTEEFSNNVVFDCTTSYTITTQAPNNGSTNAASDAETVTPPGSSPLLTDIVTGDFEDEPNNDYHLASGSNLIGEGTSFAGDFTTDFVGDTRTIPWDIGAAIATGGAAPLVLYTSPGLSVTNP